MMEERRYRDDEVAKIFEAASTERGTRGRALAPTDGLTLAELREIGREVGVSPDRITEAATALDAMRSATPRRSHLGLPVSVGRTVDLPRAPSDHEWEVLLGELRETFGARGRDLSHGDMREWRNGNLHAYVERTATGHRLRLGTVKGDAVAINRFGAGSLAIAPVVFVALMLGGQLAQDLVLPVLLGTAGVGSFAYNALRLPGWARRREEQMEHIAERARALIREAPTRDVTESRS